MKFKKKKKTKHILPTSNLSAGDTPEGFICVCVCVCYRVFFTEFFFFFTFAPAGSAPPASLTGRWWNDFFFLEIFFYGGGRLGSSFSVLNKKEAKEKK